MKALALSAALAAAFALAGCVTVSTPSPTVPPPLEERVPAPPASSVTLIWQPGHYDWDGQSYRWIAGEWVERGGRRLWQDGLWTRSPTGWSWIPGHWI